MEPVIYREVMLDTAETGALFHRTVQDADESKSMKPEGFFAYHVKSLFIKYEVEASFIAPIIRTCKGVTTLVLYIPDTYSNPELSTLMASDLLSPTQLSIPGSILPKGHRNFLQPIFRKVTRLEVLWEDQEELDWEWNALQELDQLTHLSIDVQFDAAQVVSDLAGDILAHCPKSLRVFIFWVVFASYFEPDSEDYEGIQALHKGEVDPRAVVAYSYDGSEEIDSKISENTLTMEYSEIMHGWGHPSRAKTTMWSLAEALIEQRSRERPMKRVSVKTNSEIV